MSVSGLISSAVRGLGNRFTLVTMLPTTIFGLVVAGLYRAGAFTGPPSLSAMLTAPTNATAVLALTSAILIVSVVIQPFQIGFVRILEGYWGDSKVALALASVGIELQRRRRQRLYRTQRLPDDATDVVPEDVRRAAVKLKLYPQPARLLPTRLGNALRAYEDSAGERYGLGTVVTYPRMYTVLSERLRAAIGEFVDQLDAAAGLTLSFLASTMVSAVVLIDDGVWLVVPLITGFLAAVSYHAAIRAAAYHGELLATAYDLHRFDMLAALHLPLPRSPEHEHETNEALTDFLNEQRADSRDYPFRYSHPTSDPSPATVARIASRRRR